MTLWQISNLKAEVRAAETVDDLKRVLTEILEALEDTGV